MRNTSNRRRSEPRGSAYKGAPHPAHHDESQPVLLREPGPGTIVCPDCGARVAVLTTCHRPVSHAPGGFKVRTSQGRYSCPSSGYMVTGESDRFLLPIYTEAEALAGRLVTKQQVATYFHRSVWERKPDFPEPVGQLQPKVYKTGGRKFLYSWDEVLAWTREQGLVPWKQRKSS